MEDILIYLYDKYSGRWEDIYLAILRKEKVDRDLVVMVANEYRKIYNVTTIMSDNYPMEYRKGYNKPPFVILELKGGAC